jgi:hypothetical protein
MSHLQVTDYMEVTYDLAIAKVALQIQSMETSQFDNLFIHFGSFHIMMAYFKAIGKLIDSYGITNIMVNTDILASDSINSFITSKHFNRCKRIHPFLYLGLEMLHFETFLEENDIQVSNDINNYLLLFSKEKSASPTSTNDEMICLLEKYDEYKEQTFNGAHGKTPEFFMIHAPSIANICILYI